MYKDDVIFKMLHGELKISKNIDKQISYKNLILHIGFNELVVFLYSNY